MSEQLLVRARSGDAEAFADLIEPFRRELHVHCYRILGSMHDAEDALQEALLDAWQGLPTFEGRASLRTWLYKVATNRCLNTLRSVNRRPAMNWRPATPPPEPTRMGEITWLEPYPDVLLEGLPDAAAGPDIRYESREAISLAFITALQLLPPRQRAVLVLRDVLGFAAAEVAAVMQTTDESVTSALKRARATMQAAQLTAGEVIQPVTGNVQRLVARLVEAFEECDVDGIVALLTDDAWLRMPPVPFEYQGRELVHRFFSAVFAYHKRFRLLPTAANGQPAFAFYTYDPHTPILHAQGLMVLTLSGEHISAITRFDTDTLAGFGFPRTMPV